MSYEIIQWSAITRNYIIRILSTLEEQSMKAKLDFIAVDVYFRSKANPLDNQMHSVYPVE